jgi:hypothetical protein
LDEQPKKRTDCTSKATQNSNNTNSILDNTNIKANIASLRINAQTNSAIEFGLAISYDPGYGTYSITGGKLFQGTPGSNVTGVEVSPYSVFTAHTHYKGLNAAPSCGDVIGTVGFYKDVKSQRGNGYKGTAVFASDGSEYVIYVDDPAALERFYNGLSNDDFYTRGGENGDEFMTGSDWGNTYYKAKSNLLKQGYSENDAQSYALTYVLDYYNMGLKISSRTNAVSGFKEQKTDATNITYTPKICP